MIVEDLDIAELEEIVKMRQGIAGEGCGRLVSAVRHTP
jgi:hypothetical protein